MHILEIKIEKHGHLGQEETFRCNGEDTKPRHEAGMDSASLSFLAWLPLPQKCEGVAGHAGHRAAQIRHRDFHPRLFLARTCGGRAHSPFQQRILAQED